jgi:beta-phosphoglucomutase family hydrolase
MQPPENKCLERGQYDAILLDLDGVITDTASIHAACWKKMFDEYLQTRSTRNYEVFHPFDIATDYRLYVDGKPRFDGVRDFLRSRHVELPDGTADGPARAETVWGLGNRKNDLVTTVIRDGGVRAYKGSVELIHQLSHRNFKMAVVTSSRNCEAVLKAVNLDTFFEVRVDGNMIEARHLRGKPAPDTYLTAAKLLEVEPSRAVVIEDAISGVEAGSKGAFGLVIGVARKGNADELRRHGANLIVDDLGQLVNSKLEGNVEATPSGSN